MGVRGREEKLLDNTRLALCPYIVHSNVNVIIGYPNKNIDMTTDARRG